jgi:hypothetical protein
VRLISSPDPQLARVQRRLARMLQPVRLPDEVVGFRRGGSARKHAIRHLNRALVIRLDIEDFFWSIDYDRVLALVDQLGAATGVRQTLALLLTEPVPASSVAAAGAERRLAQGAPSSPFVANLVCRPLDHQLASVAAEFGCVYSRFADDLVFSSDDPLLAARVLVGRVRVVAAQQGFRLNDAKTRVMPRWGRQVVTGIVVNGTEPRISREDIRRFRALLHRLNRDGEDLTWAWMNREAPPGARERHPCTFAAGYLAHVLAVNPGQAHGLMAEHPWLYLVCPGVPRCLAATTDEELRALRCEHRRRRRSFAPVDRGRWYKEPFDERWYREPFEERW